ncbi:hypothetical protein SETIT_8G123900v2 [Setaria italica]|uniref:Uncharacterized protein n=1 Tax=Setaria italica TaxID=4555 RepID=A0A368S6Z9_SETIT|nr:hypothetical protein SETIT_8G123900v2 [Setaria italica]
MGPDFRFLVRKSRKQAQQYYRLYKETIPVTQLVRETAAVMQEFTQSRASELEAPFAEPICFPSDYKSRFS